MSGNDYPGTLIAVEGIDGSGKSNVVSKLESWGRWMEDGVFFTKEPTPFMTGEWVYEALKNPDTSALTDFLLFCADRTHHVNYFETVLEDGGVVVSDRYADSTRAYQTDRLMDDLGMSETEVAGWVETMMEPWNIEPDLTIYIDVPAEVGLERCDKEDKFENRETLEAARDRYHAMYSHRVGDRDFAWIDGQQSKTDVSNTAIHVIEDYLNARAKPL